MEKDLVRFYPIGFPNYQSDLASDLSAIQANCQGSLDPSWLRQIRNFSSTTLCASQSQKSKDVREFHGRFCSHSQGRWHCWIAGQSHYTCYTCEMIKVSQKAIVMFPKVMGLKAPATNEGLSQLTRSASRRLYYTQDVLVHRPGEIVGSESHSPNKSREHGKCFQLQQRGGGSMGWAEFVLKYLQLRFNTFLSLLAREYATCS